jgi:hypothetical protein
MNSSETPEWAHSMNDEGLLDLIREMQHKHWSEWTAEQRQVYLTDRSTLPVTPALDEIYSKICHVVESLYLNHKDGACDEHFFDVEFGDGPLMTSDGARRVANQIFGLQ